MTKKERSVPTATPPLEIEGTPNLGYINSTLVKRLLRKTITEPKVRTMKFVKKMKEM